MKRWTFPRVPLFSLLSLALLAATIVFWVRSRHQTDCFILFSPAGHYTGLAADREGVAAYLSDIPAGEEYALTTKAGILPLDQYGSVFHDPVFDKSNVRLHLLGFWTATGVCTTNPWKYSAAIVPYWALILIFALLPLRVFPKIYTRWQRKRRGQCLHCGYDLRHSPGRCPECGKPAPGSKLPEDAASPASGKSIRIAPALFLGILLAAGFSLHRRNQSVAANALDSASLDRPIAELNVDGHRFGEAVHDLRLASGVNIAIGKTLAAQIDRSAPLEFHVRDVNTTEALRILVQQATHGRNSDCEFAATRDGQLVLRDSAEISPTMQVYDIADLLDRYEGSMDVSPEVDGAIQMQFAPPRTGREMAAESITDTLASEVPPVQAVSSRYPDNVWRIADRVLVFTSQEGHATARNTLNAFRCGGSPEGAPVDPEPAPSHADIDQRIKTLDLSSATFESAIDTLRKSTDSNIVVFWDDLAAAGIDQGKPVHVQLADVTLRQALDVLSALMGPAVVGYDRQENIIRIGSKEGLLKNGGTSTRLYDVRDLIDQIIAYQRSHAPPPSSAPPQTEPTQAGVTNQLFAGRATAGDDEVAVETLVKTIEDQSVADTWKDNGGSEGSIREFAGRLIITQTPENHQKVVQLLRALRAGGSKEGAEMFKGAAGK